IVGLGEAVKKAQSGKRKVENIKKLRNKLITGILRDISGVSVNGSLKERLPNNAHLSFDGVEGEGIVFDLSSKGVLTSTSSACASHSLAPSHVLLAIGLKAEDAHSSVRFTLGKQTTSADIDYVLKILPGIVKRLRKISGYK
ncbi:MAG: aminotransferase class V-fold PLP-dependent enzyme, partial [Candidatus Portnoybacteria bacterium]